MEAQHDQSTSFDMDLEIPFVPAELENLGELEQENRKLLASGVPVGAPACEMHRNVLKAYGDRNNPFAQDQIMLAWNPDIREETVSSNTALLPYCQQCFRQETGLKFTLGQPSLTLDLCFCASGIVAADCWYCAFGELEKKLRSTITERTRTGIDGQEFLACGCGSQVMTENDGPEVVRKCIGCDGILTAPFKNFGGNTVAFQKKSMLSQVNAPPADEAVTHTIPGVTDAQPNDITNNNTTSNNGKNQRFRVKQLSQRGRMHDNHTLRRLLADFCKFDGFEIKTILDLLAAKERDGIKNYNMFKAIEEALAQIGRDLTDD